MESLADRPNLLFTIFVRNKNKNLLVIRKLNRPLYRVKIAKILCRHLVYKSGKQEWRVNGLLHRETGPAVIFKDGTKYWYCCDVLHRDTRDETGNIGPAMEYPDGYKAWYRFGQRHRLKGPAVIWNNGSTEFWKQDKRISAHNPDVKI